MIAKLRELLQEGNPEARIYHTIISGNSGIRTAAKNIKDKEIAAELQQIEKRIEDLALQYWKKYGSDEN